MKKNKVCFIIGIVIYSLIALLGVLSFFSLLITNELTLTNLQGIMFILLFILPVFLLVGRYFYELNDNTKLLIITFISYALFSMAILGFTIITKGEILATIIIIVANLIGYYITFNTFYKLGSARWIMFTCLSLIMGSVVVLFLLIKIFLSFIVGGIEGFTKNDPDWDRAVQRQKEKEEQERMALEAKKNTMFKDAEGKLIKYGDDFTDANGKKIKFGDTYTDNWGYRHEYGKDDYNNNDIDNAFNKKV